MTVFPPPVVTKHQDGKESILASKLLKGDGNFEYKKDMIGFSFDGIKQTAHLPPAKAAAYIRETHCILHRKSVPLKILQGVVRKLQHASIILPAACGFFTPINAAMKGSPKHIIGHPLRGQGSTKRSLHPPAHPGLAADPCPGVGTRHAPLCGLPRCGSRRSGRSMVLFGGQYAPGGLASGILA